jgi:DNA invertase Pin-like site-specific DNA recombinase
MKAAIYTRFSSDRQREASTEDQARNCRRRLESEGFTLGAHFRDEAMSGSISARPGYQKMLKAAEAREFVVLVVDDLSRLSRDQVESERTIRRLEFSGVRIIGVSDGYDSQSKSRKVQRGVRGLMNEIYLDDLKDKTHRGLAGQALKKYWAGGKPYGYSLAQIKDESRRDTYGNPEVIGTTLAIEPTQAAVVREIFGLYAEDYSQVAIAETLNRRKVPSPGSSWKGRTVRRTSGWLGSTINSLLENELYRGKYHWNKSEWRKDPDSGRRKMRVRPKSEWITNDMPELRILDEELWHRAQERRARSKIRGAAVGAGIARGHSVGGGPRYAFSGLLKCELCGSSLVIIGGSGEKNRTYGCSGNKFGGSPVCANAIGVRQTLLESKLCTPIKRDLLTPAFLADIERRVIQKQATRSKGATDSAPRVAALRQQIENLGEAVASGGLRNSPALAQRLTAAEEELATLLAQCARPTAQIIDLPARLAKRIAKLVDGLELKINQQPHRARAAIREICGDIPVRPDPTGKFLLARVGLSQTLLAAVAGSERFMVAGARYVTFRRFPVRRCLDRKNNNLLASRSCSILPDFGGTLDGR